MAFAGWVPTRGGAIAVDLVVVSSEPVHPNRSGSLELPVEELLRRARPLPPHDEMVIDDITVEEGAAFLIALEA